MCNETYNGWTNHATWAANLWLDGLTLEELINPDDYSDESDDRLMLFYLADAIKEYVQEFNPLADEANLYSDLLNSAISSIDYRRIAEGYLEDYRYDNPRKVSDTYTIDLTGNVADTQPYWVESDDPDMNFCDTSITFWGAFNLAIENAIEKGWNTIEIAWRLDPSDLTSKGEKIVAETVMRNQVDRMIRKQASRSSKPDQRWFKVRVYTHSHKDRPILWHKDRPILWEILSNEGDSYDVPNTDVDSMGVFNTFYEAMTIAGFTAVKHKFASLLLIPSEY